MLQDDKKIIWLASYPKSGNTWFRIFLNYLLSESKDPININNIDTSFISSSRLIFDEILGENASNLTEKEIDILKPEVYKKISFDSDKYVFIKTHDAWYKNDNGEPIIPSEATKKVIYFVRNPLDIAISFSFHGNISISKSVNNLNMSDFGLSVGSKKLYLQIHQKLYDWSYHVQSWTRFSKLPVHIIRYEDMISNTLEVFTKSLDFLNIDHNPNKVAQSLSNSSFINLKRQEEELGFKEKSISSKKFFRSGQINDWRNYLNKKQVLEIASTHKDIMKNFGYLEEFDQLKS